MPRVQSQPGLQIETLSQKAKNAKTEQPTNKIESGEIFFPGVYLMGSPQECITNPELSTTEAHLWAGTPEATV